MIEVYPKLWVGNGADADAVMASPGWRGEWFVISAAKEKWHREALGYTSRGAPRDDPEYLIAHRAGHLVLNLVDTNDVAFVNPMIIETALEAISENITRRAILVHCNEGKSRAPTMAMLWMAKNGALSDRLPFEAIQEFRRAYPDYAPAEGMRLYAQRYLEKLTESA